MSIVEIHRRPHRTLSIAINGDVCAGSSTVATHLAEAFSFTVHDIGRLIRRASSSLGYDNDWEALVSTWSTQIWNKGVAYINTPGTITEGRLVGLQGKDKANTLKILCVANEDVALSRFIIRRNISSDQAPILLKQRRERDDQVLQAGWGVTRSILFDPSLYDIVVDTSVNPVEKTAHEILSFIKGA